MEKMDHCSKVHRRERRFRAGGKKAGGAGRSGSGEQLLPSGPGWLVGRRCYSSSPSRRVYLKTRSLSGSSLEIMSWRKDFRGQPAPMKPSFLWPNSESGAALARRPTSRRPGPTAPFLGGLQAHYAPLIC